MNALLNFFMYNFELFTCTRPQMSGNTYVQYSGRNVADFLMQNSETWGINDSDLLKKSAELLQDTTSEFYVILEE